MEGKKESTGKRGIIIQSCIACSLKGKQREGLKLNNFGGRNERENYLLKKSEKNRERKLEIRQLN